MPAPFLPGGACGPRGKQATPPHEANQISICKTFKGYIQFPPLFSREELESCRFIREHKNLILYGPVGTGKTHLAIAIGVKACQMGLKTKFFSVTELILKLAEACKQGTREKLVKDLQKQDLLILDEWSSIFIDDDGEFRRRKLALSLPPTITLLPYR
ncbi:ATP-binding protein [Mitsuokella multacida]|uniref:ATP-binding protein n=1 Tax=Mitsuokella multacida TaxID=52226 RepID=UPI0031EAF0F6